MWGDGGNASNGPVELNELGLDFAGRRVLDEDAAADAQIAVEPGLVQRACVLCYPELLVSDGRRFRRDGLHLCSESIHMACDHLDAITGLVFRAHGEGDQPAAVPSEVVFAPSFELGGPLVFLGEMGEARGGELGAEVRDGVEDGGVVRDEVKERFGVRGGFELGSGSFGERRWRSLKALCRLHFWHLAVANGDCSGHVAHGELKERLLVIDLGGFREETEAIDFGCESRLDLMQEKA